MTAHGRAARGTAALVRVSLLFACLAASSCGTEQPADVVTLWHAYDEAEAAGLHAALDGFRELHPGVQIAVLHNAFDGYGAKLESAIPTGRGPDLFIDAHERLSNYRQRRLIAPVPALGLADRIEFEPAHLEALEAGGVLYGLPLSVKCAALYVNTELVPTVPDTFEGIEALGDDLPRGVWPLAYEAESSYYNAALLHAYGGSLIDGDGRFAFDGPAAERTLNHVLRLVQNGTVPEESNGDLVRQLFASGHAATAISGPWLAPRLPSDLPYRVVPLPRVASAEGAPMRPFVTIETLYLTAGGSEQPLAVELQRYLAGAAGARLRATAGHQVVAALSPWADPELRDDPFLRTFRRAAANGVPMSTHPHMRQVFEPALRATRKVLRGDADIGAALREARERFEDVARPPPPRRSPSIALLLIGLLLLAAAMFGVARARDPDFRQAVRRSVPAYRYVAHAVVAIGLLVIAPLMVGAAASLFAGQGTDMHYVGLANYFEILSNRGDDLMATGSFWVVLLVTVLWTLLNVALHVVLGVALALLLSRPILRMRAAYRVLLILPWAVPSYVTALSWKGMFHRQFGAINAILDSLGAEPVSWFGHWSTAFSANLVTNVWLGFPFMMVVTLGALAAIPKDLHEAAAVDGAGPWQRFTKITLPLLKPMLAPAVVMGSVWTFNMFNVVFLVSGGEPDGATEILVSEAYRWAFTRSSQYGYAAAYAVLIFAVLLLGTRLASKRLDGMGATT